MRVQRRAVMPGPRRNPARADKRAEVLRRPRVALQPLVLGSRRVRALKRAAAANRLPSAVVSTARAARAVFAAQLMIVRTAFRIASAAPEACAARGNARWLATPRKARVRPAAAA